MDRHDLETRFVRFFFFFINSSNNSPWQNFQSTDSTPFFREQNNKIFFFFSQDILQRYREVLLRLEMDNILLFFHQISNHENKL